MMEVQGASAKDEAINMSEEVVPVGKEESKLNLKSKKSKTNKQIDVGSHSAAKSMAATSIAESDVRRNKDIEGRHAKNIEVTDQKGEEGGDQITVKSDEHREVTESTFKNMTTTKIVEGEPVRAVGTTHTNMKGSDDKDQHGLISSAIRSIEEDITKSNTVQGKGSLKAEDETVKVKNTEYIIDEMEESEDEGIDDIGTDDMDHTARDALYERGVQYESKKKKKLALRCFLQCLKGLSDASNFVFLPQCLRKIADLYFETEELGKAIQFIQAEKMYYESALIDTTELQKKLVDRQKDQNSEDSPSKTIDPKAATPEIVRADEYEKLARMCLDQKQPQLALEYQGKATKIRQHIYGNSHPVTIQSLDFFTVVYGEVGKHQYSESVEKMQKTSAEDKNNTAPENGDVNETAQETSPSSILRKRNKILDKATAEADKEEKKKVRFAEAENRREQEEWISQSLLWVLFIMCFVLLTVIVFYLYCKVDEDSSLCTYWKTEIFYYYMRIKYMYHYYIASRSDEVVG